MTELTNEDKMLFDKLDRLLKWQREVVGLLTVLMRHDYIAYYHWRQSPQCRTGCFGCKAQRLIAEAEEL